MALIQTVIRTSRLPMKGFGAPIGKGIIHSWQFLRSKATKAVEEGELDEPIQFSTSNASSWTARNTHMNPNAIDMPPIQPFIVSLSTGIFLLYFLALREENDMDEEIGKPIWEKVPGLEKQQLELVFRHNLDNGVDNTDVLNRLRELNAQEATASAKK